MKDTDGPRFLAELKAREVIYGPLQSDVRLGLAPHGIAVDRLGFLRPLAAKLKHRFHYRDLDSTLCLDLPSNPLHPFDADRRTKTDRPISGVYRIWRHTGHLSRRQPGAPLLDATPPAQPAGVARRGRSRRAV